MTHNEEFLKELEEIDKVLEGKKVTHMEIKASVRRLLKALAKFHDINNWK